MCKYWTGQITGAPDPQIPLESVWLWSCTPRGRGGTALVVLRRERRLRLCEDGSLQLYPAAGAQPFLLPCGPCCQGVGFLKSRSGAQGLPEHVRSGCFRPLQVCTVSEVFLSSAAPCRPGVSPYPCTGQGSAQDVTGTCWGFFADFFHSLSEALFSQVR